MKNAMDATSFKFHRIAGEAEVRQRMRTSLRSLGHEAHPRRSDPRPPQDRRPEASPELSDELCAYLLFIRDRPGKTATERDRLCGKTPKQGSLWRKELRNRGLIEEHPVNPGAATAATSRTSA